MNTLLITAMAFLLRPDSGLQLTFVDTIVHKAEFITTDPLGNLYTISGVSITKFNSKGDSLFSQNFNDLRNIEYFDASQALKLYAVNFSFNTLIILDNTLSAQNNPIQLDKIPIEQVTLLCASNFNSTMWLYDGVNMQLVKTDQNFRVLNASVNFYSHNDLAGVPNYMVESNNNLYINIPENGIKVFNQYCNFIQNIPVQVDKKFVVRNQKVYYLQNGLLKYYNMFDFSFGEINTGLTADDFSIEKNKLYIKQDDRIYCIDAEYEF